MSVVGVQVGQCGNQVGAALYAALVQEATSKHASNAFRQRVLETFFREPNKKKSSEDVPIARAILVDMEPKVQSIFYTFNIA